MIRYLKHGDSIPTGIPQRYIDSAGYVMLSWKVGTEAYVRVREHRLMTGLPNATVHHRDGNRSNNDLANLEVMPHGEHAKIHNPLTWDIDEAMRLYSDGWILPKLAERYGVNHTTVLRAFQRRGFTLRMRGRRRQ